MADEFLSIPEFAKRCGNLSPWTICSWLSKGILVRSKFGSRTMIRSTELSRIVKDGGKSRSPRQTQKSEKAARPPVPAAQPAKKTPFRRSTRQRSPDDPLR
jgi:hypothetical protein